MKNTRAQKYLENSEFLKVLGQLPPNSEERRVYLRNHPKERKDIEHNIIYCECPFLDSEFLEEKYEGNKQKIAEKVLEESNRAKDLDMELLEKHISGAFRNWRCTMDNPKSFRNYVLDYYHLSQNSNEGKAKSWVTISSRAEKILGQIRALEGQGVSLVEAIDELSDSEEFRNVTKKVWNEVIEAHEHPFTLSLNYDDNSENSSVDFLEVEIIDENKELTETLEQGVEWANAFCERAITDIRQTRNIKDRERMMCAYSSAILKTLKYWKSEKTLKKIVEEPAVNAFSYELWESNRLKLMTFVFDKGYIEFLIQDTPESLEEFYGVCYNLMHENREIDNKNMLEYINRSRVQRGQKPISESALSQWLKNRNLSFSGYKTSDDK